MDVVTWRVLASVVVGLTVGYAVGRLTARIRYRVMLRAMQAAQDPQIPNIADKDADRFVLNNEAFIAARGGDTNAARWLAARSGAFPGTTEAMYVNGELVEPWVTERACQNARALYSRVQLPDLPLPNKLWPYA